METIRQYMESLFISLPNTAEVRRAKAHLLEMAEDKYTSLIEDGVSDNEAVAKVIAEFGNLDELKDELGLTEEFEKNEDFRADVRCISLLEVKKLIEDYSQAAIIKAIGVMCFICCVVPPILIDSNMGPAGLFIMIGVGVMLSIIQTAVKNKWDFIEHTRCGIEMSTADYVKDELIRNRVNFLAMRCLGVLFIITCFVPAIMFDSDMGAAMLFIMIGLGVGLLIFAGTVQGAHEMVLSINPQNTVGATYSNGSGRVIYDNKNVAALMSIYWPLVVCLYLSISFLTFSWGITWIIFVIAGVLHKYLEEALGERE